MTITRPPKLPTASAFIAKAPDAVHRPSPPPSGEGSDAEEMTQITLRISVDDLAKIDAEAKRRRISRAGFLRQAAFDLMGR